MTLRSKAWYRSSGWSNIDLNFESVLNLYSSYIYLTIYLVNFVSLYGSGGFVFQVSRIHIDQEIGPNEMTIISIFLGWMVFFSSIYMRNLGILRMSRVCFRAYKIKQNLCMIQQCCRQIYSIYKSIRYFEYIDCLSELGDKYLTNEKLFLWIIC